MKVLAELSEPKLTLAVQIDDAPHILEIAISPRFPDFWMLKERLPALPPEVMLALVEKEFGPVFGFVEDTFRVQLSVEGVKVDTRDLPKRTCFRVELAEHPLEFGLDLTPEMTVMLGALDNLEVAHESIRSLSREGAVRFATLPVSDDEIAALATGDCLLLPDGKLTSEWLLEVPDSGDVQVLSPQPGTLTFAQLADDDLPTVEEPAEFRLVRNGKEIAKAVRVSVGIAPALKII